MARTRRGRTKAGEATPRRAARALTAEVLADTSRQGTINDGEVALARTSGEQGSTHTFKRGRTEDDQYSRRGGKKPCGVSLSYFIL